MAQLNHPPTQALRTPMPASSDSDDVVLALETARALEARGDVLDAAKWLRRAAEEAESQGHDARVLLFAHVAADLTSSPPPRPLAAVPTPGRDPELFDSSEPTLREPDFATTVPRAKSIAHSAPDSSLRTIPDAESSPPAKGPPADPVAKVPQPARVPNLSPSLSFVCQLSVSPERPVSESTVHVGAIRVAIRKSAGGKSYSVEPLEAGESLPAGTIEGLLVIARNVDGTRKSSTEQLAKRPPSKR